MKKTFIKKGIFACIAAILGIASSFAQTINTGAVSPTAICAGGSISVTYTTTGTVTAGTTFSVELSDATGVFPATPTVIGTGTVSPLNAVIPAGISAGSGYIVRVTAPTPAVLGTTSSAVAINAVPVAPTVVTPVNYTVGTTPSALPTQSGYLWYSAATGGTGSATAPTPTATTAGTTSYHVSQTVNGCEGPRAEIEVIVSACATAAPTVVTPVNYTVGATPSALPTQSGYLWYSAATGGTGSATAPTPTATTAGTTSYYVSQTVNGCEGPRAKIDVVVTGCATVAPTVVTPVNYTVGATPSALPTQSGYLWYSAATGGTGSATAPTPTATIAGTTSYYVSQTVNGCEGPRAKIDVVVTGCATVAPTVVTPVSYTVGATPSALPTQSGYLWYSAATGGTGSATAPTPTATTAGTTSYYVSQTVNGCEGPRAKIDVVVTGCATVAPTVVTPVNYTIGATPSALPTQSGYLWYSAATGGTGSATAPTPTATTAGTTSYYVSQTVNGCEGPRAKIDVVVTGCATVAPTVVTPVSYTVDATPSALPTQSGYLWYSAATGGTGSATAPTPTATTAGTTSYYVSQTVNGCEGPRAKIDVVVTGCATVAPTVVTPVSYTVGATPSALPTQSGYLWYSAATGGTGSATAPTPTATTAGTTSYYVSQTVNGCEGPRAKIDVVVTGCATAAPTVVTPVNYTVGATPSALPTQSGYLWYSAATGGTGSATAPTPTATTAGTTSYYVSQTVNGCEGPRAKIDVVVTGCATAAPTVVTPVNYTVGATPSALPTQSGYLWYSAATGGTGSATAPTPTATTAGATSYYVSQTVNGCEGPRAKIDVVVSACSTPAPVVANVSYCLGETGTPLTATGTALKWYAAQTGGSALAGAPLPVPTSAGTFSYYVSQTLNGCESPRAKIDIIVNPQTPAPGVANVTYCLGETGTPLTATGTALKWYAAQTGGSALAGAPLPVPTSVGTFSYYVSQTLNGCEGPRAKIDIIVNPPTQAPTVTSPVSYFAGATNAVALTATGTALKWYTVATGGTALSSAPIPSTTTVGTTSYYVSQTVNGCEGPRAKIDVVVSACSTPAPVVANVSYCLGETGTPLTATGTALKWYAAQTGGSALAGAPLPVPTSAGTFSYYVSQTLNGCESPRAKIDIIVNPQTPAPGVANVTYCLGQTGTPLTATGTAPKWYAAQTGGSALAGAPLPVPTSAGTFSYYVSQTLNGCEGPRAKIDIIVNPQTQAPTVSAPSPYCFNQTATALTATGTGLKWYTTLTGGTALGSAPVPVTTTAGTVSYYVSQTVNTCEGLRAKVDVIVKPQVPAPTVAAAPIEYCQSVKASPLTATVTTGSVLSWYGSNATGGTASGTAPTPSTETEGTTAYYVNQTDVDGCISPRARIDVKINVTPKPTLTTPAVAYCQNEVAPALTATGSNLKWYLTIDDTNPRTTALIPFTEKVSDYSFYVTQTGTNTCESPKAEIKVHIKPLPSATISGNSSIALGQATNITVNFTGDGPWKYILSSGQTATTNDATIQVSVSPTTTTSYVITEVSNSCGKGIPNGVALVTVLVPTITTGIPSVSQLCAGRAFTVPFQQSGSFPTGNAFTAQIATANDVTKFASIPSVVNGNVLTATVPDTVKAGSYFIRIVSAGRDGVVPGSVSSGKLTINPLPVATITGPATILQGQAATLNIAITGDAPWTFSFNDGSKDSLISSSVSPVTIRVTPKTTTVYQITSISNGCGVGRGAGSLRVQVDPVLGTEPPVVAADWLKIYPTMIDNNTCIVEITNTLSTKEATVEVIDLAGRSLSKSTIRQKVTEVDFSSKPSGMYLLKVQNGDRTSVQRIFKQ